MDLRLFAPPRGRILDRFGAPLALNRQDYRVLLIAEKTEDVSATLPRWAPWSTSLRKITSAF
ncbi:MAG: hypothetical protein HC834_10635 [Rhodospirillales bacterium]|nr:hypothetical protein [Rhodospirillales bacterium]